METTRISELVRALEDNSSDKAKHEYGEAVATMIANFGPAGRAHPDVITGNETLVAMLVKVFEKFIPHPNRKKTGVELIDKERWEQIEKHGFDVKHDDYSNGELVTAALFCIEPELFGWPWDETHFQQKILNKSKIERLTVAGAFFAAEIDRLQAKRLATLDGVVEFLMPRFEHFRNTDQSEDDFAAFMQSQLSGGIGMRIRNEFELWIHESPLHQYFLTQHNLFEADAMSDLILRTIYRKLKPVPTDGQPAQ